MDRSKKPTRCCWLAGRLDPYGQRNYHVASWEDAFVPFQWLPNLATHLEQFGNNVASIVGGDKNERLLWIAQRSVN